MAKRKRRMGTGLHLTSSCTAFIIGALVIVLPAACLAASLFFGFSSLLPVPKTIFILLEAVVFVLSLASGGIFLKKRDGALFRIEIFFLFAIGLFALEILFSFIILSLDYMQKLEAGLASLALFLVTAGLFIACARLLKSRQAETDHFRFDRIQRVLENILLILFSAVLFALSFPNFISPYGFGFLAFIALFPLVIVINRAGWLTVGLYAILFSLAAYALFNFWLALFHPVALTVVLVFRLVFSIPLFFFLKLADSRFPKWAFIVQSAVWVAFEYLSTQGFLGYAFGLLGSSQYLFTPFIQIASLTAVWGVSLVVAFPGIFLGHACKMGRRRIVPFLVRNRFVAGAYGVLFLAVIVFGLVAQAEGQADRFVRVACVQPNIDPWKGGDPVYESSLRTLISLSDKALAEKPDLVVWPETALVPSLRLHTQLRFDQERYNRVIRPFLEYVRKQSVPFLVGNNERELAGKNSRGAPVTRDFNSTILLVQGEISGVYRKTRLVPFTEHFPHKDIFPGIYEWLLNEDTHFYESGGEEDGRFVFSVNELNFSTPICFEDTFGDISRRFVRAGAALLINLTNDSWSGSIVAEMQHLAAAVLRTVETRRSLVRCTTSGITCVIDPYGRITDRIEPFREDILVAQVPVRTEMNALAVFWGDWFGLLLFAFSGFMLVAAAITGIVKRLKKGN